MFSFEDQRYTAAVASDVQRDGMALEVFDDDGTVVAEVFYAERVGRMTLSVWRQDVPVAMVEWAIAVARQRILPQGNPPESGSGPQSDSGPPVSGPPDAA